MPVPISFENARPIWIEGEGGPNVYAEFFAWFAGNAQDTRLLVAADSHYAVYVNGEYVYAAQFADDPRERVFDEIDISALVRGGVNELRLAGYWAGTDSSVYLRGDAYVIFEIFEGGKSVAFSGAHTLCRPDKRYAMGEAPLISGQMGYTFGRDDTAAQALCVPARLVGERPRLVPRPIQQCRLGERCPARLMSQGLYRECGGEGGQRMQRAFMAFREREEMGINGEGKPCLPRNEGLTLAADGGDGLFFLVDLGRNEVGLLDIELETEQGAEVLIAWGEHVEDLRVRAYVGGRNFMARWVAPAGRKRFMHPFRRVGARYVQVFVRAARATVVYAGLRPVTYPVPEGAKMELGEALHREIYRVCKRTLIMCMHEHYEDCPWREQALYAMDSRNQMLTGYYVFGEYAFARASLRTLGRSLRADGLLELCAPGKVPVDIPSFSMMYLVEMWEYLLFSGDDSLAREMMPVCRTIIETAGARIKENGLLPRYAGREMWNFYEWSPELNGGALLTDDGDENRFDAPLNAFFILALQAYACLNDIAGSAEAAQKARAQASALRARAHAAFYRPDRGNYATYLENGETTGGSELTQALCVCAGICPAECADKVLESLVSGELIPVTLAYSVFKYEALLTRAEKYGAWVKADVERLWGQMLYQNATSFWETIAGAEDFERAGSLCHGWSAVPAYLYFAYGAGAKPVKPGWKEMEIRPAPGMPGVENATVRLPDGSLKRIK